MKNKMAKSSAEGIVGIGGAIILIVGALIFLNGMINNNPNSVSTGAVTGLVGIAILAIAKKLF